jgi:hypothetical protein
MSMSRSKKPLLETIEEEPICSKWCAIGFFFFFFFFWGQRFLNMVDM